MAFPNWFQYAIQNAIFLLPGLLILAATGFLWWTYLKERRKGLPDSNETQPRKSKSDLNRDLGQAIFSTLLASFFIWESCTSLSNALSWRNVVPDKVEALEIVPHSETRGFADSRKVIFQDKPKIVRGLQTLTSAKSWTRNRVGLSDGYRLRIKFAGQESFSEMYLSAYRLSSGDKPVYVVIPHIGTESSGTTNNAGTYECPEFHVWLAREIDPLFAAKGK